MKSILSFTLPSWWVTEREWEEQECRYGISISVSVCNYYLSVKFKKNKKLSFAQF